MDYGLRQLQHKGSSSNHTKTVHVAGDRNANAFKFTRRENATREAYWVILICSNLVYIIQVLQTLYMYISIQIMDIP